MSGLPTPFEQRDFGDETDPIEGQRFDIPPVAITPQLARELERLGVTLTPYGQQLSQADGFHD